MHSSTIYNSLIRHWTTEPNKRYCQAEKNIYLFTYESDILFIDRNDQVTEVEVKVSKGDFLADFKKGEKHKRLSTMYDLTDIPNYFYFACPKGLLDIKDVPEYAGLVEIHSKGVNRFPLIKKIAPHINKRELSREDWKQIYFKSKK